MIDQSIYGFTFTITKLGHDILCNVINIHKGIMNNKATVVKGTNLMIRI